MRLLSLLIAALFLFSGCSAHRSKRISSPPVLTKQDKTVAWSEPPMKRGTRGLIVIDPGHGGEDQGTKSLIKPIYAEKNLNLRTAKMLSLFLENVGFKTILTRTDDTFVPLKERATFANERRPLLFVSVHFNAAPSTEAKGVEIFYFKSEENKNRTKASRSLANYILGDVLEITKAPSRGVKHGNYAVIRETDMPAVLVEGGFLSNSEDLQKLKDPAYLKLIAKGIADGIDKWAHSHRL